MDEQAERILKRACAISGAETAPENGEAIVEQAMEEAMAFCRREDIPAAMECLVARLAAERILGENGATRIKLGDTEVEYAAGTENSVWNSMKEFRRL